MVEQFNKALLDGKDKKAKKLLEKGIQINQADEAGLYPIIAAVRSQIPRVVQFVINHGADVSIQNDLAIQEALDISIDDMITNKLMTPNKASLEIINLLMSNGAQITTKDETGKRPLDIINDYAYDSASFYRLIKIFKPVLPNIEREIFIEPKYKN